MNNRMHLEFPSYSQNESFARMVISAFVTPMDPTLEELSDIKTAVSEAVTNAIIHGYENEIGIIYMDAEINDNKLTVVIKDKGKGIEDVKMARQPLYTSRPDLDRSGMGFTIMESFMDNLDVISKIGEGTTVIMTKLISTKK
ncbi:anti-sigma F factor [Calorimonas adulescens]|uniref:Anti-sigma F factor n=1 Tax=Calorimonas adulescens TaxID=2606906 RepID=A0A5D8QBX4_9THEO|nr:anti-sigma F factor [Calorimonas adulescens]TZE82031.1 anti-sigma F factor [Calorimonas adulescens]